MTSKKIIEIGDGRGGHCTEECMEPLWYLEDGGDHFLVGADLPYVYKEDLEVSCWQRSLEIKARSNSRHPGNMWSFRAVIVLPSDIVADGITARFVKQILEVRIPKDIQEKKRIKIE